MPPLYNAYEAKLLNVLHSKLCKEKKKKMISLSWATAPFKEKVVYFHGRPAHTYSLWSIFRGDLPTHSHGSIFTGDLPTHTQSGLFSRATCPHTHTMVYFQGRPAHTYSKWSIFTGDLPTHSHWSIFTGDLPTHTQSGLFSKATYHFDWVYLRSHLAI